jgi:plastocyanin
MARIHTLFACVIALAALAACSGDSSRPAEPASPAAAPDAKKVDSATASSIKGKVLLEGTPPENPVLKMASDPACGTAEVRAENYVAENGALQNVFVHIKDGLGNKYIFDTPTEPAKLDQKGCRYVPHVLGVRVSQPLEVINSDQTLHNVHGMPKTNREFNHGQPIAGMKNTVTFSSPEVMVPFKCDVHAWMLAYVGVVPHPYFAVTGKEGTFELQTIPPGTYTIEAWHEKLGRQTQTVTLGEKDSKDVTFTFKVAQ